MIYMGIDPGVNGGVAYLDSLGRVLQVGKIPEALPELWLEFRRAQSAPPAIAVIEKVHASPQMGVVSATTFGRGYGVLLGMLTAAKIPYAEVVPRVWQRYMECLTGGDKNVSKRRAQALFPEIKVTHAIADALLIAEFCRRQRED